MDDLDGSTLKHSTIAAKVAGINVDRRELQKKRGSIKEKATCNPMNAPRLLMNARAHPLNAPRLLINARARPFNARAYPRNARSFLFITAVHSNKKRRIEEKSASNDRTAARLMKWVKSVGGICTRQLEITIL